MAETNLYIVRHGKTMFNTLARVQGWCDTPLTQSGRDGIHYVGLGLQDTKFEEAYSSDSGRAIETMRILLSEHPDGKDIPYHVDPRIREWCFGSLEGGFDAEMWGVLPRVLNFKTEDELFATDVTLRKSPMPFSLLIQQTGQSLMKSCVIVYGKVLKILLNIGKSKVAEMSSSFLMG